MHVVPTKANFLVTLLGQTGNTNHGLPELLEVEGRYKLFQDYSLSSRLSSRFFMMRRFIVHT